MRMKIVSAVPATFAERQEVTQYCVKCIERKAQRLSAFMSPDMDADDIKSEVRIRVWRAMVKVDYLKKTKDDLIKIGYVTAQRHISQLVRVRLQLRSRQQRISFDVVSDVTSMLVGKNFFSMSAPKIVILTESVRNEAIRLVGLGGYKALVRGIKFDWERPGLSKAQCLILCDLDYSHETMRRTMNILGKRVAKKVRTNSIYDNGESFPTRIDGVWVQYGEVLRNDRVA